jgi:hypothetical protein
MLGARAEAGCGKKGCAKECLHKTGEHGSAKHLKASSEGKTEGEKKDAPKVMTLDAFSNAEQYTCPMHPEVRAGKATKCPDCGMKLVKEDFYEVYRCAMKECPHVKAKAGKCCGKDLQKTLMSKDEYYQFAHLQDEYFCPMHPDVTSVEADKCSKCGMKLEMRTVESPPEESPETATYVCPMHPDEVSDEAGKCSKCGMKLEMRTVESPPEKSPETASYVCPMHPDEVSDKAGNCSKCGMKLKGHKIKSK